MQTSEQVIEQIKRRIEVNELTEARRIATQSLLWWPKNVLLWRLLGVIEGTLGNHAAAKASFISALELGNADIDMANVVTALLACGEVKLAIEVLESQFDDLNDEPKRIVGRAMKEALRIEVISLEWFPQSVQEFVTHSIGF
jgi:Flp pilus assembly protein TadD